MVMMMVACLVAAGRTKTTQKYWFRELWPKFIFACIMLFRITFEVRFRQPPPPPLFRHATWGFSARGISGATLPKSCTVERLRTVKTEHKRMFTIWSCFCLQCTPDYARVFQGTGKCNTARSAHFIELCSVERNTKVSGRAQGCIPEIEAAHQLAA